MLYTSKSLRDINRKVFEWLRANKISLNTGTTELVLFRSKNKNITQNINFRISGQKIDILCKTKYLGIILDEHLTFKCHLENLNLKLNRAYCLLSEIRYYIKFPLLRTLYYALFDSHLRYCCQIWEQKQSPTAETSERTQNKALRILNFKGSREGSESKINKLKNIIIIPNSQFVYNQLKNNLPETFSNFFTFNTQLHHHNTRKNRIPVPNANTTSYRSNSITLKAIKQWNKVQKFIDIDIYSPEMTYPKFLKPLLKYIESQ